MANPNIVNVSTISGKVAGAAACAGVAARSDGGGWLVLPGDMPLVQPSTLVKVAQGLAQARQFSWTSMAHETGIRLAQWALQAHSKPRT